MAASHPESKERQSALATLCQAYWYPLYAFVRRQGRTPHEAEDLTQDFFARVIEKNGLASVGPEHGRFRAFLLASLKNFLANDWDRRRAAKRGGQYVITSWEEQSPEDRYQREPSHDVTPEKVFERSWALTVIEAVLQQLRTEYDNSGKAALFAAIHSYLEGDGADTYLEIAKELNMTEGAVKMAVLRLRENFRHQLRSEIAQTVAKASEVDDELGHLFSSLAK
jgi:RNA polymerase sigma factor (sigma-70 family)